MQPFKQEVWKCSVYPAEKVDLPGNRQDRSCEGSSLKLGTHEIPRRMDDQIFRRRCADAVTRRLPVADAPVY